METAEGIINTIKERKRIEKERIQKLRDAVKDSKENPRKQMEKLNRPD